MLPALITPEMVRQVLYDVYDPELGINVVDLGLVYDIAVYEERVAIQMTLTTPGCPLHNVLTDAVARAVEESFPGFDCVTVKLVWDPPWQPARISPQGRIDLGWF